MPLTDAPVGFGWRLTSASKKGDRSRELKKVPAPDSVRARGKPARSRGRHTTRRITARSLGMVRNTKRAQRSNTTSASLFPKKGGAGPPRRYVGERLCVRCQHIKVMTAPRPTEGLSRAVAGFGAIRRAKGQPLPRALKDRAGRRRTVRVSPIFCCHPSSRNEPRARRRRVRAW